MNERDGIPATEWRSARFTGIYSDTTRVEDIIDENCPMEMAEALHENACNASQHLRTLDVTIVNVLRNDLYHERNERVRKKNKKWFEEKGAVELLEICAKSCSSSAFKEAICRLATTFLTKELDEFISTGDIYQPTTTITAETLTSFSMHTLLEIMLRRAPLLTHLFTGLVGDRTKNTETMPLYDSEDGLEFSDEEEEEEEEVSTEEHLSKKTPSERNEKQQITRWVTSLSTICFAKSRCANLQQQIMGYYLVSANTPK